MTRAIVLDMDGTIANLYAVDGWLEKLRAYDSTPYSEALPLYDMARLNECLHMAKQLGYMIIITSWLSKESNKAYDEAVRKAKLDWLEEYGVVYDEIHLVKYGTTKANCTRHHGGFQVLVDDNKKIREGWNLGATIDANEDIVDKLYMMMDLFD